MMMLLLALTVAAWAIRAQQATGAEDSQMAEKALTEGMKAPDFKAAATDGKTYSLGDFKGKVVVLYFYPKDDTPGCTKEACSFRDSEAELKKLGVVVLGVSKDSVESHKKFTDKYGLNFPLLSDPEGKIIQDYGCFKDNSLFGKTALGIERSTFVIDREGVVRKIWRGVKVDGHSEEVLAAVKGL
jgi:thioredoxin-dependent peroxiredoxin